MKLTNLNCPQCNGFLKQQRDMFFCDSCGAAFNVDYDDNDVQYAQLVTEAERTKMMLQSDLNLMHTDYQLKENIARNEEQRDIARTRKKAIGAGLKMSGMYFGSILLMVGMSVALFWYIGSKLSKSKKENDEKKATHYQELIDTVKTDTVFLENVIAAGSACKDRQDIDTAEIYTIKGVPGGMVHKVGSPEIEDVYVIGNESSTKLTMYMVYKLTYQYDESGETFPVYTGVSLSNVDMDENGYMKYDFDVSPVIAGDYMWGGFYDKDQFYRECLFQYDRNGVLMELDLSVLGKEGKS